MADKRESFPDFPNRRVEDEPIIRILKYMDNRVEERHVENRVGLKSWFGTNVLAMIGLAATLLLFLLRMSSVGGKIEQKIDDMNTRLTRVENRLDRGN